MVVKGYTVKRITALVTAKGKIYIHERKEPAAASGPYPADPSDCCVTIRDAIPLRKVITRGFAGGGKDLEDAIAGAIRTLIAESYDHGLILGMEVE